MCNLSLRRRLFSSSVGLFIQFDFFFCESNKFKSLNEWPNVFEFLFVFSMMS